MNPTQNTTEAKKGYNPHIIESRFYNICKERGYFEIEGNKSLWEQPNPPCFSIMMPPPNVTGVLHIGHALTFSLQDIITRYKRMNGFKTLYQPGLDHAGIATQNVVEKQLLAQGIHKEDLGREEFIKRVWEWKEQSGGAIINQMYHLGITPAWSRLRFTMDKGLQNAVKKAFVQWYNQGLIVQDNYMINWCVKDGALSDIEVEYEENAGKLYYLRYPIKESKECLIVATTRPETFFGDSAVMVNPQDERYAHFIGKSVILPLLNREIPIIADTAVDMDFGSGCVKVTPAHDINDYEVGKRHHLEFITIFDEKGILNAHAGAFAGKDRLAARHDIIKALQEQGFVEKIEDYTNQVGKCYRCGNVVEPYISKQWFVKKEVAFNAIKRVNEKQLHFIPPQWLNNYNAWMRELKDWCISRQLWWGHRIPVWYCECGERVASESDYPTCPKCHLKITKQDNDVLDTWFSSGLWAFSTLGWGNESIEKSQNTSNVDSINHTLYGANDLIDFYPNTLLITGFDILFFWVARMILSGESLLHKLPFKDVYLHALVRDKDGQKMAKSKGNVIDPLNMIQTYGADTLRFSLAYLCAQGRDVKLSAHTLETINNFTNKLYNAAQFLNMYLEQLGGKEALERGFGDVGHLEITTPLGQYMLARFYKATNEVREALNAYRFNDGASILYRFLWGEFCDWGIELAKASKDSVYELGAIFKGAMLLLHPYMPFITDWLWHSLNGTKIESADSIMIAPYPKARALDSNLAQIERDFNIIQDVIISIRRLKATLELGNAPVEKVYVKLNAALAKSLLEQFVCKLAKVAHLELVSDKIAGSVVDVSEYCECYMQLTGVDLSAITARLNNQKQKLEKDITKLQSMLSNEQFIKNAPPHVFEQNKQALSAAQEKYDKINAQLSAFSG
ncbi:valine--tRNA ligase [Helicobacter jaachi]|uniref:Valine--tRNA ligase n=1 Tax=Helicobacter jaachi TaxID=1677920 RepID=A0A4U8TA96_9HELI|nr:valine--tRNA ligase [Helicobacter jaachi]TLD96800.1 valine--tRNA ligase [Helicobacter jaachi]